MYWTDWDRNAIFKADKFNGNQQALVANSSMVSKRDKKEQLVVIKRGCVAILILVILYRLLEYR